MKSRLERAQVPLPAVHQETELVVYIPKSLGTIDDVLRILSDASVNVLARCHFVDCEKTTMMLVPDWPSHARRTLELAKLHTREQSVVMVESLRDTWTANRLASRLTDLGIEIIYSYSGTSDGDRLRAVFKTMDDAWAVAALRAEFAAPLRREQPVAVKEILLAFELLQSPQVPTHEH